MGVLEGLGGWGLGKWLEMGRDLGMQSMARIGAIWIYLDFSFSVMHNLQKLYVRIMFPHLIPSSTFFGGQCHISRTFRPGSYFRNIIF